MSARIPESSSHPHLERVLYPPIDPHAEGMLDVGDGHSIRWESSGNPQGTPVLFLHGGPGAGCAPMQRQFFDPHFYRIILFDQRGCGGSVPHAALESNTTWHLVDDIERLREYLGINTCMLFGGSWGSALALAYAQTHSQRVASIILRGVFTLRRSELDWFYHSGASHVFPDEWAEFLEPIPEGERCDLVEAYRRRLTHPDAEVRLSAAKAWSVWEARAIHLDPRAADTASFENEDFALAFARIENHYFSHGGFFDPEQLVDRAETLNGIPGIIVQGRYDMVTPVRTAWELSQRWEDSVLQIVEAAGHAADEPAIASALVEATDSFRVLVENRGIDDPRSL